MSGLVAPADLCGDWVLERRLRDELAGMSGRVVGLLRIEALDPAAPGPAGGDRTLRWRESGQLDWGPLRTPIRRVTLLQPPERAGGEWRMAFEDGRPFHPWRPGQFVEHPCGPDLYRGIVRIDGPDRMRVLWCVTGERKDQRILTRLRRAVSPR
jgi:hypothetical protein